MNYTIFATSLLALLFAIGSAATSAQSANDLFQKALAAERADGNLRAAIQLYERVVKEHATDRALVARAFVRLGDCYETLGQPEAAVVIYERLVRGYADQPDALAVARARLALLAPAAVRSSEMTTRKVWAGPDVEISGSLSPDGRYLTFIDVENADLAVRDLTTGQNRRLTRTPERGFQFATGSVISPDGKRVAYSWWAHEKVDLRVLPLDGAGVTEPKVIYKNDEFNFIKPEDWSPDGASLALIVVRPDNTREIGLLSLGTGRFRTLKSLGWRDIAEVAFSPDGNYLLYSVAPTEPVQQHDLFALSVDGSRETALLSGGANDRAAGWSPDGHYALFLSDRAGPFGLWAIRFDAGRPVGDPFPLKADLGQVDLIGITQAGVLYFGVRTGGPDISIATVDLDAGRLVEPPVRPITRFVGTNSYPHWSADGRFLAYTSDRDPDQRKILATYDTRSGETRELLPLLQYFQWPRWSPDGTSFLVDGTDFKGRQGIYRIDAQNGEVDPIVPGPRATGPEWAPDGARFFYYRTDPDRAISSIVERTLSSGAERALLELPIDTSHSDLRGRALALAVAPDGERLAYVTIDPRTHENLLSVIEIRGAAHPRQLVRLDSRQTISNGNSANRHNVTWTADAKSIVYQVGGSVWVVSATGGEPRRLDVGATGVRGLQVHPDGRRIAFISPTAPVTREVWTLENFVGALNAKR